MKLLVTGSGGFIGRSLIREIVDHHDVCQVVRRFPHFAQRAGMIVADFIETNFVDLLPHDIDCVVHLAQSSRYREFPGGVADMQRVNVDAFVELLEWARETGVKQFIFASSANVYAPSVLPLSENSPLIPRSFYGATKLAAEHFVRQYEKYFQVDILRLFTVYGPGQQGMLIANIIERIMSGYEITLAAGVGVYLTPIFVGDVVNIIKQIIAGSVPAGSGSRIINVCGNQAVSLAEIITHLERLLNCSAVIRQTNDDVSFIMGENARLRSMFDEYTFVDLFNGLGLTVHSAN